MKNRKSKIKYDKEHILDKIDSVYEWFNSGIMQEDNNRSYQNIWEELYNAIPYKYILENEEMLELITNICKENYKQNLSLIKKLLNQPNKMNLYKKIKISELKGKVLIKNNKIVKECSKDLMKNNDFEDYLKKINLKVDVNTKFNEDYIFLLFTKAQTFEEILIVLNEVRRKRININAKMYQPVLNAIKDELQLKQVVELENKYSRDEYLLEFRNAVNLYKKANKFNINIQIKYNANPPKEEQLALVIKNEEFIKYIDNPQMDIQMAAVKKHLLSIKYIRNPFPEVEEEVISELNQAILYLNKTEQIDLIKNSCILIKYISKPSKKMKIEAVKQDGLLIRYINNVSVKEFPPTFNL